MYKKILSLSLVLLMAFSCFSLSVSAYDPLPEEELMKQTLKEAYIEYWTNDIENKEALQWFNGKLSYFGYLGEAGCYVFQAAALPGDPVEPSEVIGNYRFTAHMCVGYCDTNPAGVYAYKDGVLMTLKEAYNKGLVDLDLLYEKTDKKAYTMTPLSDEEILKNKCRAEFMEEFNIATKDEDEVYIGGAVKFTNYTVFGATFGPSPTLCVCQYIDGYWFYAGGIHGDEKTNPIGMYTLDNYGNVQSLAETASEGFIEMKDIFEEMPAAAHMYMVGDIDGDKKLTVKDATLIQKYLAKIPEAMDIVNSHLLGYKVMDADLSGGFTQYYDFGADVNIKDATYIQKKVAKIFGEDDRQPFEYGEILVFIDGVDTPDYTLEDFPEYAFTGIEVKKLNALKLTMIKLKFEAEGEAGVINAINSLKHREGTEFESVSPNALFYPD